jgi:glycosyltransferase involved in cell wall biosynthesis
MSENSVKLSVAIITKNEEDRLPKTLEAVKDIADEIVVVDSGSTDKTVDIAKQYGAKVFIEEWKGYGEQKNSALKKTTGEWVLFLDADEVLSEELKKLIKEKINNPTADGYYLKRQTVYLGRKLKHIWNNDWVLRLVNKNANPRWVGNIHEKLSVDGKTEYLKGGVLYHYTYRSLFEHFQKSLLYAKLSAEDYYERGIKSSKVKVIFIPFWNFFKFFILKKGFLEGFRGFLIAFISAFYSFAKYAILWDLYRTSRKGKPKI